MLVLFHFPSPQDPEPLIKYDMELHLHSTSAANPSPLSTGSILGMGSVMGKRQEVALKPFLLQPDGLWDRAQPEPPLF